MFGDIRSVVQSKPTQARWLELIALLEGYSPQIRTDRMLPYVQTHVRRWPDEVRTVPMHWLDMIVHGLALPEGLAVLPRHLKWTHAHHIEQLHQVLRQLPRQRWLHQLRRVDLSYNFLKAWPLLNFLRSPQLGNLHTLTLSFNAIGGLAVVAAMRLEHLRHIRHLAIDGMGIEDRHVMGMVRTMRMTSLESLSLANNRLSDATVQELMFGEGLEHLRTLDLSSNALTAHGLHAMGVGHAMPALMSLNLSRNTLSDMLDAIDSGPFSNTLRHLNLNDNPLHDVGVESLARGQWRAMSSLLLRGVKMSSDGWLALTQTPWVRRLNTLELAYNPIFDAHVSLHDTFDATSLDLTHTQLHAEHIPRALNPINWPRLERLSLSFNELGDHGLNALMRCGILSQLTHLHLDRCDVTLNAVHDYHPGVLRHLDLSGNALSVEGLRRLLNSKLVQHLESLCLKHCHLNDALIQILAQSPICASLTSLHLGENQCTDDAAKILAQAHFPRLRALDLSKNMLGEQGVEVLARAPWFEGVEDLALV